MVSSCYIHIPFCKSICSYCDFCKVFYSDELCHKYLDALKKEIIDKYKKEELNTLYIGGGTPSSLSKNNIEYLFDIINLLNISKVKEFTFECNVSDINKDLLNILKSNKVNRLSIGVETINKEGQILLDRVISKEEITSNINLAKEYFDNINIDLIYAYKDETIDILKEDLDFITSFNPTHISTYSLIIEEHTKLNNMKIKPMDEELDSKMYYYIRKYLKDLGYNHIEISNFAKVGYEPIHNLVYWNNEEYYGFGAGASGYLGNIRYSNTRNIYKYINNDYEYEKDIIDIDTDIENYLMLGLRKIEGISKSKFKDRYNKDIREVFDIDKLVELRYIKEETDRIYIPEDKLYISNYILLNFIGGLNE